MEVSKKSKAQLYAEQRDYKRRRKSYRAKNIRITKRTPTQVIIKKFKISILFYY